MTLSKGERNKIKSEITSDRHKLVKLEKKQKRTMVGIGLLIIGMVMNGNSMDDIKALMEASLRDPYDEEERRKIMHLVREITEALDRGDKVVL